MHVRRQFTATGTTAHGHLLGTAFLIVGLCRRPAETGVIHAGRHIGGRIHADDARRDQDKTLHALMLFARRAEQAAQDGDVLEAGDAGLRIALDLVIMSPDEQALPFSHDGLGIDLGLLDGRKVVGIHGKKAGAVVPVVLHADHELDAVRLPRQAGDNVGRHLQDGPGVDLEQVGRFVARYGNVVGAGIFQRGLHVVHGQHGRLAQHAGLTVFFQSGDAGQEVVRAVGIQGGIGKAPGTGSPGRGEDAAGRSAPGTAAACPVLAVSTGTRPVDAEITGEIAVDIHDGRMDLHKLHRLVQSGDLVLVSAGVFCVIAAADWCFQKWQFNKQHMMSKEEVKREFKESEGDPLIKGKRKQLHQEMIAQNQIANVRKAKVLVTNPTHFAVALDYEKDRTPLPVILAKGQGVLAQRMIETAREEGIPIMRNVPLARSLYEQGTENAYIPQDLIGPVAEVLRWVQSLRQG